MLKSPDTCKRSQYDLNHFSSFPSARFYLINVSVNVRRNIWDKVLVKSLSEDDDVFLWVCKHLEKFWLIWFFFRTFKAVACAHISFSEVFLWPLLWPVTFGLIIQKASPLSVIFTWWMSHHVYSESQVWQRSLTSSMCLWSFISHHALWRHMYLWVQTHTHTHDVLMEKVKWMINIMFKSLRISQEDEAASETIWKVQLWVYQPSSVRWRCVCVCWTFDPSSVYHSDVSLWVCDLFCFELSVLEGFRC